MYDYRTSMLPLDEYVRVHMYVERADFSSSLQLSETQVRTFEKQTSYNYSKYINEKLQ